MAFELWLAFTLASAALLAIPGPTVTLVISYVFARGRQSAWASVPGVVLGDFTAMSVSLLGAGAVLQTSATLFTAMKLIGAAYLIWLGINIWRSNPVMSEVKSAGNPASNAAMFWNAYVVTSLNPKGIIFFIAFLPQFVDPGHATLPQFALMEVTFLVLAGLNVIIWALMAGKLQKSFKNPSTYKLVNRIGGGFLVCAGLLTAATR